MREIDRQRKIEMLERILDKNGGADRASNLLEALEAEGMSIYKKKIIKERRPNSSQPMSEKLRAKILADYRADPSITQSALAARYNVNSGRVAEVLGGE